MAALIRHALMHDDPVVVQAGVVNGVPSKTVEAARPAVPAAPRIEPPNPAALEAQLRRQVEVERVEALRRATDDGLAEGQRQGRAEWAERVDQLDHLLASIYERVAGGSAGVEDLLVEVAFEAAAKVIGAAGVSRAGVQAIVRESLRGLSEREQLVLRLAPRDVEAINEVRGELKRLAGSKGLEIVADERVEMGGCLIETTGGGLDARLETQLQRLRDLLVEATTAVRGPGA